MSKNIIHVTVFIRTWGNDSNILEAMKSNSHIISIYHIMGKHSYLVDANFDDKKQLSDWINYIKSIYISEGVPAVMSLRTQKVININKQKKDYTLDDYMALKNKQHFFVEIDNPHHDEILMGLLVKSPIVHSILHVQGESSFIIELILKDYTEYTDLLGSIKDINTIHHIETFEVISVIKYRNKILDAHDNVILPGEDNRELFTL
ncbi:hypothetical protein ACFL20_01235 [Spirochaetota bacterium]